MARWDKLARIAQKYYKKASQHLEKKGGPLGSTFARALPLLIETLAVFAIYYAYALLAETSLPLYALALMLVAVDKAVNWVRRLLF